jgi:hypothetical protein
MANDNGKHWWYCLTHHEVEGDDGCPGKDRLGPYATREEAARALELVQERNREWDARGGDDEYCPRPGAECRHRGKPSCGCGAEVTLSQVSGWPWQSIVR